MYDILDPSKGWPSYGPEKKEKDYGKNGKGLEVTWKRIKQTERGRRMVIQTINRHIKSM